MNWTNIIQKNESIKAIFGEYTPSLEQARLMGAELDIDRDFARIRVDIRDYPLKPPVKWQKEKCNQVQIELTADCIEQFSIEGYSSKPIGAIVIERRDEFISFKTVDSEMKISILCGYLTLSKISANQCERIDSE